MDVMPMAAMPIAMDRVAPTMPGAGVAGAGSPAEGFGAALSAAQAEGVPLIDCQQNTGHLASLGARPIPRDDYVAHVARVSGEPDIADWTYDATMWARLGI